jgi:cardiolipin synthase (CMP-forming)
VDESPVERRRLTFGRLVGVDRSGPPPPETLAGQPLNVWTIPNAIGFTRLLLIPVFLIVSFNSDSGVGVWPAVLFGVAGWSDYFDGIAARVTGQYSRFGTLLDPITDRLLVLAGVIACWYHELLPRWALAILVARELFMLIAGRVALNRGVELSVNMVGRLAIWPVLSALEFAFCGLETLSTVLLYIGVAMTLVATALYVRDARPSTSAWASAIRWYARAINTFPDLGSLSDQELKEYIQQLTEEEIDISYKRRILHGKIDILRAELVNRLRKKHETGEDVITGDDVQKLTDILAGRAVGTDGPEAE